VSGQGQPGLFAIAADGSPDRAAIERPAPFTDEEGVPRRGHPLPFLEPRFDEPQFIGPQGMRGGQALLEPGDMQDAAFGIDLGELQPAGFRNPQAVAEEQQDQAAVTGLVARALDGGQQLVDFQPGEVFARIHRFVPSWGFGGCFGSTAYAGSGGKHRTK